MTSWTLLIHQDWMTSIQKFIKVKNHYYFQNGLLNTLDIWRSPREQLNWFDKTTQHTKTLSSFSVQLNARFIPSPLSALLWQSQWLCHYWWIFIPSFFISDVNVDVGALLQLSSSALAFFLIKKLAMWKIKKKAKLTPESQPTSTAMIHNFYGLPHWWNRLLVKEDLEFNPSLPLKK